MTLTTQREGKVQAPGGNVWYKIGGDGPGVPLLLLHGGPGAGHDYLEPMATLGDDRPVVFYDQLGCGNSDNPNDTSLWDL
ncbi:MAG: alpha/beta fold hydrolase, partial [Chloroflexota bacterium]